MVSARPGLRRPGNGGGGVTLSALDAFHPSHLPLPRAVAPYSVVRTTSQMRMQAPPAGSPTPGSLYLVGSYSIEEFAQLESNITPGGGTPLRNFRESWASAYAIGWEEGSTNIANGELCEAKLFSHSAMGPSQVTGNPGQNPMVNLQGAFQSCTVVPAAVSIQITNPEPIQTTSGQMYACRLNTQFDWRRPGINKIVDFANAVISYNCPRILPAAKLAFRGVKADCVPYNMAALASFLPLAAYAKELNNAGTINDILYGPNSVKNYGFAPIFVYLPQPGAGEEPLSLQCLVCTEWRLRFDPLNPAQAAHTLHPTSSDSLWAKVQHAMSAQGHGIMDIVEQVANWGTRAAGVVGTVRRARALAAGPSMLMLGA